MTSKQPSATSKAPSVAENDNKTGQSKGGETQPPPRNREARGQ
jgi:hypothetical protein